MTTFESLLAEVETLKVEFEKFTEKNNKSAGTRARNALSATAKLCKLLRTEIQEAKQG